MLVKSVRDAARETEETRRGGGKILTPSVAGEMQQKFDQEKVRIAPSETQIRVELAVCVVNSQDLLFDGDVIAVLCRTAWHRPASVLSDGDTCDHDVRVKPAATSENLRPGSVLCLTLTAQECPSHAPQLLPHTNLNQ